MTPDVHALPSGRFGAAIVEEVDPMMVDPWSGTPTAPVPLVRFYARTTPEGPWVETDRSRWASALVWAAAGRRSRRMSVSTDNTLVLDPADTAAVMAEARRVHEARVAPLRSLLPGELRARDHLAIGAAEDRALYGHLEWSLSDLP